MYYSIGILSVLLLLALIYENNYKINRILIPILIFFLSFSYNMGIDWTVYKSIYENIIPNLNLIDILKNTEGLRYEKGYLILNYIFYNLGFNYNFFMGIVLMFCNFIIINYIKNKSKNFYLALAIAYIFFLFNYNIEPVVRQLLSITIIILGIDNIRKKRAFKFYLFVVIAMSFHNSAIIAFFFYFIPKINLSKKIIFILFIISYVIILNFATILDYLTVLGYQNKIYLAYVDSDKYGSIKERSFLGNIYLYIQIFFFLIIIIKEKKNNFFRNFSLIYVLIYYNSNKFPIISRLESYFIVFFVIVISNTKLLKNKYLEKLYIISLILMNSFIFYYRTINSEKLRYKTFKYSNYIVEVIKNKNFNFESKNYYKKYRGKYLELLKK